MNVSSQQDSGGSTWGTDIVARKICTGDGPGIAFRSTVKRKTIKAKTGVKLQPEIRVKDEQRRKGGSE